MATRTTTDLEVLLVHLEKKGEPVDAEALVEISREIGKLFEVHPDEVALLELSGSGKSLQFLVPEKLRGVGTIPLSSATALAARTARDHRADIINNFPASRHATVFEAVPLGRSDAHLIQKIMSAPILREGSVVGVVQISRKGMNSVAAGPDFTPSELGSLQRMGDVLSRVLTLCHSAQPVQRA